MRVSRKSSLGREAKGIAEAGEADERESKAWQKFAAAADDCGE